MNSNRRIKDFEPYFKYLANEKYILELKDKFKDFISSDLIEKVEKEANNENWIIVFGYGEKAFTNKGGWYPTNPYPFLTSDGLNYIDMYSLNENILEKDLNMDNFVTPFNKNKDKVMDNGCFVLDKNKIIYKVNYPDIENYKHVYVIHIPVVS